MLIRFNFPTVSICSALAFGHSYLFTFGYMFTQNSSKPRGEFEVLNQRCQITKYIIDYLFTWEWVLYADFLKNCFLIDCCLEKKINI